MYGRNRQPAWRWGVMVRVPGCVTQALAGALVLGLMILLALVISAYQFVHALLPH
jgi:hypothetical protein